MRQSAGPACMAVDEACLRELRAKLTSSMQSDPSKLDLNLLVALDVLLRERNVTRAAKKLGITQSAMSHKLKRLREELGDPLFVSAASGLIATPRAERMELPLRSAIQGVTAAVTAGAPFDPRTTDREIRIACADAVEITLLPRMLARLAHAAPRMKLSIRRRAPSSVDELASGSLDLLVLPGGVPGVSSEDRPGIQRRLLQSDGFLCVVRADHPTVGQRLTLQKFLALDHLLVAPGGTSLGVVDQVLASKQLTRRVAVTTTSFLSAPLLLAQTDMVLTCPASVAKAATAMAPVRLLAPPIELPVIANYLLWHERYQHDAAHQWMREFAITHASPDERGASAKSSKSARPRTR